MQDRPDASELMEAVGDFMEKELLPTITDARLRFRTLVALNVLSIVNRELATANEFARGEWLGLARLLGQDGAPMPSTDVELLATVRRMNAELCGRIRSGQFDQEPGFSNALQAAQRTVIDKLRVANPRYLQRIAEENR